MDIKQIQKIVGVTPDGINGPKTQAAIKAYQSAHGLVADGIVGPKTVAVMQGNSSLPDFPVTYPAAKTNTTPTSPTPTNTTPKTNTQTNNQTPQPYTVKEGDKFNPFTGKAMNYPVGTVINPDGTVTQTSSNTSNSLTNYDSSLASYGITQDVYNQMSPTQQAVVSTAAETSKALYGANASNVTLSDALAAASTDPTLLAKYSDALKIDTASFQQQLQTLAQNTTTLSQQQKTQFENERKALSESEAQAGRAYSGFRKQAQGQLAQSESDIVTSSRSALQKNLQDLTTAFEQKYGTSATNPASMSFLDPNISANTTLSGLGVSNPVDYTQTLSGTPIGGITGSQETAKKQDINTLAGQYVTLGQLPQ